MVFPKLTAACALLAVTSVGAATGQPALLRHEFVVDNSLLNVQNRQDTDRSNQEALDSIAKKDSDLQQ
jgi:hypothetical protein